jgi:hypothetical protein
MTLICGATQEVQERNAGYMAARYGAEMQRVPEREAGS